MENWSCWKDENSSHFNLPLTGPLPGYVFVAIIENLWWNGEIEQRRVHGDGAMQSDSFWWSVAWRKGALRARLEFNGVEIDAWNKCCLFSHDRSCICFIFNLHYTSWALTGSLCLEFGQTDVKSNQKREFSSSHLWPRVLFLDLTSPARPRPMWAWHELTPNLFCFTKCDGVDMKQQPRDLIHYSATIETIRN